MGFFKDFKDDFSQAVDELMLGSDDAAKKTEAPESEDMVVNTLDTGVDTQSELSKLDGLLEPVQHVQREQNVVNSQQVVNLEKEFSGEVQKADERTIMEEKKEMNEEVMTGTNVQPEMEMRVDEPISDEVAVITEGTNIKGDITSNGSIDIRGRIEGNVGCRGKLVVTGILEGNSDSSEFFADAAKVEGEVKSSGTVKIGIGSVVIGNITATSAVIAGAIKGDVDVQGPVVVDTSAVVMGNIKSRSVQINNGAVIEGFCSQCYADIDVQGLFDEKKGI